MSEGKHTVVIDNGTGYTKAGYAGNCEPNFIVPSLIANPINKGASSGQGASMNFARSK